MGLDDVFEYDYDDDGQPDLQQECDDLYGYGSDWGEYECEIVE